MSDTNPNPPATQESIPAPAGQADGSPQPTTVETQGAPATQETPEQQQIQELRRKLTEQSEQMAGYRDVVEVVRNDPALLNAVKSKFGEAPPQDEFLELDQAIDDGFDESSAKLLKGLLRKAAEITERKTLNQVRPLAQEIGRTKAETQFIRGLEESGLDPVVYKDPEFQSHLKELRATKAYQSAERDDPAGAAEWAAMRWQAKTGTTRNYAEEKRRIDFARNGSTSFRGSSNRAPSPATVTPRKTVRHQAGLRALFDATEDGTSLDAIDIK